MLILSVFTREQEKMRTYMGMTTIAMIAHLQEQ